jgi:ABC-type transporter Mla subunit MlaD
MSAGQVAALIAAGFFAAGVCAGVFVLLRLAGLISHANRILTDYGDRASTLIDHAQAAVERTNEQLARTDSITASMDEVTANMADLSGHVSALAGLARGISAGLGAPLLRLSALAFGVRRAVTLRRPARPAATAPREPGALSSRQAAVPAGQDTRPAARDALPAGHAARLRGALPRQRRDPGPGRRQEVRR